MVVELVYVVYVVVVWWLVCAHKVHCRGPGFDTERDEFEFASVGLSVNVCERVLFVDEDNCPSSVSISVTADNVVDIVKVER